MLSSPRGKLKAALIKFRQNLTEMGNDERRRNEALAAQLAQLENTNADREILLIVGAGHQLGLQKCLEERGRSFSSFCMVEPMLMDLFSEALTKCSVGDTPCVSLDGNDSGRVLVSGNDFYSCPRLNPEGSCLAWLTWNHPNIPWDGS